MQKRLNFSVLKEFKDTNGRLFNIEANKEDPSVFHEVNDILADARGQIILTEHFNQVLDGVLGKSQSFSAEG